MLTMLVRRKHLTDKRAKDMKTSLQKLADATNTDIDELDLPSLETTYLETLHTYFSEHAPEASASTKRNTVQNLKQFYRLLHGHGFLKAAVQSPAKRLPMLALRREYHRTSPYADRYRGHPRYALPPEQWPASIQSGWARFCDDRSMDVRPVSMAKYQHRMNDYVGYNLQVDASPVTTWDELFDVSRLVRFVNWHAKRIGVKRISTTGKEVFRIVAMVAKHAKRSEFSAIRDRERKLPIPEPMHNKQDAQHTFSAQEIESVALALLAKADRPVTRYSIAHGVRWPGLSRAINRRDALLLRLMWRVPMRNRQFREMQFGKNLFKDADGQWILQFSGDELKVGERHGRINVFRLPFPPELVESLEEYLERACPVFPQQDRARYVFPTRLGAMFSGPMLRDQVGTLLYAYTGKRFYPHLARTLWVDRYLLATGDISTAAFMLGDSVQMMLRRYHELRGADHTAKAFSFNQAILGNSKQTARERLL
jgi:hypothetical protein